MTDLRVVIDGKEWCPENDETAEYDTIHTVAGAILAGAETVEVHRNSSRGIEVLENMSEEERREAFERFKENMITGPQDLPDDVGVKDHR